MDFLLQCHKTLFAILRATLERNSSEVEMTATDPWDPFMALLQRGTQKAKGFFKNIILKQPLGYKVGFYSLLDSLKSKIFKKTYDNN